MSLILKLLYSLIVLLKKWKKNFGRNEGRADDNEKTILKRIDVFEKETRPLAPIFEKEGILVKIDCNRTKEDIFEDIKKKLVELNLA